MSRSSLRTTFLIAMFIWTQISLFGIVETTSRKTCICITTSRTSSPTLSIASTTPSTTSSTTTTTTSPTSSATITTPSPTSRKTIITPSPTSSTTTTTPSPTSSTTTTISSPTSSATTTTSPPTYSITTTTPSLTSTTTIITPSPTSSATTTTPSSRFSATIITSSPTSGITITIPSSTSSTTTATPSSKSSKTITTPSPTSSATKITYPSTSSITIITPSATSSATIITSSPTSSITTPSTTSSAAIITSAPTSSKTTTTPSSTSSATIITPSPTSKATVISPSPTSSATIITPSPTSSTTITTSPPKSSKTITTTSPRSSATITTPSPTSSKTIITPSLASSITTTTPTLTSSATILTSHLTSSITTTTPSTTSSATIITSTPTSSITTTTLSSTSTVTIITPSATSTAMTTIPPQGFSETPKSIRKRRANSDLHSGVTDGNYLGFIGPNGECICSTTSDHIPSTSNEKDYAKVLSRDKVPVKVLLVVSINARYTQKLSDKSSTLYKKYKTEFKSKLENAYMDMDDFLRVDVLGFRNGSIKCSYAVVLQPGSVLADTNIQTKTNSLQSVQVFNSTMKTENKTIVEDFQEMYKSDPCISVDCGYGYQCTSATSTAVTCEHVCSSWKMCKNDGICLLDDRHELPFCRCKSDDRYTYSGNYCEIKNEKFLLSKTNIIAIAAGSGGGLLTILIVIIIVLALKRKSNGNTKQRNDSFRNMKSVSMDDLRLDRMNDTRSSNGFLHRPRIHASENQYDSGLPDTKYVQGREHKVITDNKGEETYIYQPLRNTNLLSKERNGSMYSNQSSGPSVYDYIDTDSKFEIQRPNIRFGHLNKY